MWPYVEATEKCTFITRKRTPVLRGPSFLQEMSIWNGDRVLRGQSCCVTMC
jgi:hypothetical protein